MQTPTPPDIRARSPLLTQRYPLADPESPEFVAAIEDASALVASWTGRLIEPVTEGEEVPDGLVGIARRAIAKLVEQIATTSEAAFAAKTAGGRRLRSISAGPWSESYFAPGELSMKNGVATITGDPTLDALLWTLATETRREEWVALASGKQPPAAAVTEFDYRRRGSITVRGGVGPDGY